MSALKDHRLLLLGAAAMAGVLAYGKILYDNRQPRNYWDRIAQIDPGMAAQQRIRQSALEAQPLLAILERLKQAGPAPNRRIFNHQARQFYNSAQSRFEYRIVSTSYPQPVHGEVGSQIIVSMESPSSITLTFTLANRQESHVSMATVTPAVVRFYEQEIKGWGNENSLRMALGLAPMPQPAAVTARRGAGPHNRPF